MLKTPFSTLYYCGIRAHGSLMEESFFIGSTMRSSPSFATHKARYQYRLLPYATMDTTGYVPKNFLMRK